MDPFDTIWVDEDPLGRSITFRKSIVDAREIAGEHKGPERLSPDDVRSVVVDPDRIDLTSKKPRHREIFYRENKGEEYRYSRVVVDFDEEIGSPISWSRYKDHVSFMEVLYEKNDGKGGR
mgnify:CR=1 FL=1